MGKTMAQKIICLVVACLFFVNSICYGLGTAPGSTQPVTRDGMNALGQKLFAMKRGPGAIEWSKYIPGEFIGQTPMFPAGFKFVKSSPNKLPPGLEKSSFFQNLDKMKDPISQKISLVKAFEYFRDEEAKIPAGQLEIQPGDFDINEAEGELGIARIYRHGDHSILAIHRDFIRRWNQLLENDRWLEYTFPDGQKRVISAAWGLFFRVAKHEMTDLAKKGLIPKGNISHITAYPERGDISISENELAANLIQGKFSLINDSIWMWFLGSYCFTNITRYDNDMLRERLNWFFDDKEAQELKLNLEFPNLLGDDAKRRDAINIALMINREFFDNKERKAVLPATDTDEGVKIIEAGVFDKHTDWVRSANETTVKIDGLSVFVSASYDNTVRFLTFDTATKEVKEVGIFVFNEHLDAGSVQSVNETAVKIDGLSIFAVALSDGTVRLLAFDTVTRETKEVGRFDKHTGFVQSAKETTSKIGGLSVFISASYGNKVRFFTFDTVTRETKEVGIFDKHTNSVQSASETTVKIDGLSVFVSASYDSTARFFTLDTATKEVKEVGIFDKHTGPVQSASETTVKIDGLTVFISASYDSTARFFTLDTATKEVKEVGIFDKHTAPVLLAKQITLETKDGLPVFVSTSMDRTIRFFTFDINTGKTKELARFDVLTGSVQSIDETTLKIDGLPAFVVALSDGTIRLLAFDINTEPMAEEAAPMPPEATKQPAATTMLTEQPSPDSREFFDESTHINEEASIAIPTLSHYDKANFRGKKVFVRGDLNVSDETGKIKSVKRLTELIPTLVEVINSGATVILASHNGRPGGKVKSELSLGPVAKRLKELFSEKGYNIEVNFLEGSIAEGGLASGVKEKIKEGAINILENTRFFKGEEKNDSKFAQGLAELADNQIYLFDAFGTAERVHSSTGGAAKYMQEILLGFLMEKEFRYLQGALDALHGLIIGGGPKVSEKVPVVKNVIRNIRRGGFIIIGTGPAPAFLKNLYDIDLGQKPSKQDLKDAEEITRLAAERGVRVVLPIDFVLIDRNLTEAANAEGKNWIDLKKLPEGAKLYRLTIEQLKAGKFIDKTTGEEIPVSSLYGYDIGKQAEELFRNEINATEENKAVFYNGTIGVEELAEFGSGSKAVAAALVEATSKKVITVIGGGDTTKSAEKNKIDARVTHCSTGGGASAAFLRGERLAVIKELERIIGSKEKARSADTFRSISQPAANARTMSEKESISEIISVYAVRPGFGMGPGSITEPATEEIASFYPIYGELNTQRIEICLSQHSHASLTASVRDEIKALNKRIRERTGENEDAISITPFNSSNLKTILGRKSDNVRRIFVNDTSSTAWFRSLLESKDDADIDLLKGKRIFTTELPQSKDDIENSVNQAWLMKISTLSCLLNEGNIATVGLALKAELEGRLEGNVSEFVNELAKEEDGQISREAVAKRVNYFLGKIVKLSVIIGEQLRILKAFWVAA